MWNQKLKVQNIFVKTFLSKDGWENEKKLLDYRFKLAQKLNINRSEIKIRSGALFVENQLVDRYFDRLFGDNCRRLALFLKYYTTYANH